ncbi:hypothetical protein Poli38472_011158 [Pythium oligandrum]|uniref:Uncharacterized protein n=1 Tax=Pythium oligandrum TaxID=41045 RepID=A0A8K1CSK2_PYTOL|nr:hypothetical protein Poli38472_011158 [Pythium oligandrum]|eukprot:TMW67538.1 hypothetical protein Poli38472_011158 [Pythium oligandrum]
MKTFALLVFAATVCAIVSGENVKIRGAMAEPMAADKSVRIASKGLLNQPTTLINKNTVAMDNNVLHDGTAATLTRSVMRAVSAPDSDSSLMTKASAVVAAKGGDASTLSQRIADFVDAAATREAEHEQSVQSETPRGIIILVGTKDLLRQPAAVVNKNAALSDDQIAISRTVFSPSKNDRIALSGNAKVANVVLPASAVRAGQITQKEAEDGQQYRMEFAYRLGQNDDNGDNDDQDDQGDGNDDGGEGEAAERKN